MKRAFTVVWYECDERKPQVFTDEESAHEEAQRIVRRLAGAEMKLSAAEAEMYTRGLESLRDTGVALDAACAQFAKAGNSPAGKLKKRPWISRAMIVQR